LSFLYIEREEKLISLFFLKKNMKKHGHVPIFIKEYGIFMPFLIKKE